MATLINYSHEIGIDHDIRALAVCAGPGLAEPRFVYVGSMSRLREIWREGNDTYRYTLLTEEAGAPLATRQPYAFVDTSISKKIVVFIDNNENVHAVYWSSNSIGTKNLSGEAGAPGGAYGKPVGLYSAFHNSYRVIYLSSHTTTVLNHEVVTKGHLRSLWWPSLEQPVQHYGDMTLLASAPTALNFTAYAASAYHNIIYTSSDGHIRRLYWTTGTVTHENLSSVAGSPLGWRPTDDPPPEPSPDRFSPSAYYTAHNDMNQIVYLATDGHLWELYWQGDIAVRAFDLMAVLDVPQPENQFVSYYNSATNTKHVIYPHEGNLHELWWTPGDLEPAHNNLTEIFGLPRAARFWRNASLVGFAIPGSTNQHVAYISEDQHIFELIW